MHNKHDFRDEVGMAPPLASAASWSAIKLCALGKHGRSVELHKLWLIRRSSICSATVETLQIFHQERKEEPWDSVTMMLPSPISTRWPHLPSPRLTPSLLSSNWAMSDSSYCCFIHGSNSRKRCQQCNLSFLPLVIFSIVTPLQRSNNGSLVFFLPSLPSLTTFSSVCSRIPKLGGPGISRAPGIGGTTGTLKNISILSIYVATSPKFKGSPYVCDNSHGSLLLFLDWRCFWVLNIYFQIPPLAYLAKFHTVGQAIFSQEPSPTRQAWVWRWFIYYWAVAKGLGLGYRFLEEQDWLCASSIRCHPESLKIVSGQE